MTNSRPRPRLAPVTNQMGILKRVYFEGVGTLVGILCFYRECFYIFYLRLKGVIHPTVGNPLPFSLSAKFRGRR